MSLFDGRRREPAPELLPEWLREFLLSGTRPERGTLEWTSYLKMRWFGGDDLIAAAWRKHGAALTAEWVREHPGSRPSYWWTADAPEDDFVDFPEGIEDEPQESYRARLEAHERESEASDLRRHGLLLPGEEKRIPKRAFAPRDEGDAA